MTTPILNNRTTPTRYFLMMESSEITVPNLKSTLSQASPHRAAQIRSAVTGCLKRESSGLLCFERTVETTFLLPWDLNPKVYPGKLSESVRDIIRSQLLESGMLLNLESLGVINWNTTVVWQGKAVGSKDSEWADLEHLSTQLEAGYCGGPLQGSFLSGFTTFQVDYTQRKILNMSTQVVFDMRRISFAPLMPMKTEEDGRSLYHAVSLGLWGIHDRTGLLSQAVAFTLADPKAQFLIYDRWSQEMARNTPSGTRPEFPQWEAAKKNFADSPQLHIFTLANIVQRPILIYAHPDSPVGGIYLPLLWEDACGEFPCRSHSHLRNPLAIAYDVTTKHFSPLVTFKGTKGPDPILYPLTIHSGRLLIIHFLSQAQHEADHTALLSQLMFVDLIPPSPSTPSLSTSQRRQTLSAISSADEMPEVMDKLVKQYQSLFL